MKKTRDLTRTGIFTALCAASSLLARFGGNLVPFSLVPFAATLAGAVLGPRFGATAVLAYILLGLLGLPLFAAPPYGGPLYVLNPTFGYLPGMALAAFLTGLLLEKKAQRFFVVLAAVLSPYLLGLPHLALIMAKVLHKPLTFKGLLLTGMIPFLFGDLLKALVAVYLGELVRGKIKAEGLGPS